MVAAILLGLALEPDLWQEAGTNGTLSGVNPQQTKISRNVTIPLVIFFYEKIL